MSVSKIDPAAVDLSVVCPVGKHVFDLPTVHREFDEALSETGRSVEFVYVVDGQRTFAAASVGDLRESRFPVRVFTTARGFGEATALQYGFERARGRFILTIADRPQIDAATARDVLDRLERGHEVVVTRREPRTDAWPNRLQSRVFHALVRRLVGHDFRDLSCGLRGFTAEAARRLELYGDQHRFIPVIAARLGYRVLEIPGRQHAENTALRLRAPGLYASRLLDVLNIYFLTRFTRRPLRFFGMIGAIVGGVGFAISAWLAAERLLGFSGLAERPLLLLGVLLIVVGVQVVSIGLLAEIIIFLSARREIPQAREVYPSDVARKSRSEPAEPVVRDDAGRS
jgi:CTP:molybdopterin cytidylyltransferase MocA